MQKSPGGVIRRGFFLERDPKKLKRIARPGEELEQGCVSLNAAPPIAVMLSVVRS